MGDSFPTCFLLDKPNTFLDSSVGRAPDCYSNGLFVLIFFIEFIM